MKFEQYLNEKYYDSFDGDYEIFINPSKRDIRDLDAVYGYRFFMDFRKKNLYIFNENVYHREVAGISGKNTKTSKALDMVWKDYWTGRDGSIAYVIMGDCNKRMTNVNSDVFNDFGSIPRSGNNALGKLMELQQLDYSWLSKYGFYPDEVKSLVDEVLVQIDENY